MKNIYKEITILALLALPFLFFTMNYSQLPDNIPTHYNYAGEADDFSSKSNFIYFLAAIGIGIYLLMLILPKLDPKKRLLEMGEKYTNLRIILTLFFSAIMCYIIYSSLPEKTFNPNFLLACISGLFVLLGNYFQTIRPNYFVGIRTPWTLENEDVWKKTHKTAGKIWMAFGILAIILAFFLPTKIFTAMFLTFVCIMVCVPVIHSYVLFRRGYRS